MKGLTGYMRPFEGLFGALAVAVLCAVLAGQCSNQRRLPRSQIGSSFVALWANQAELWTTDDLGTLTALYTDWRHLTNYTAGARSRISPAWSTRLI